MAKQAKTIKCQNLIFGKGHNIVKLKEPMISSHPSYMCLDCKKFRFLIGKELELEPEFDALAKEENR